MDIGIDLYCRAKRKTVASSVAVRVAGLCNGCRSLICHSLAYPGVGSVPICSWGGNCLVGALKAPVLLNLESSFNCPGHTKCFKSLVLEKFLTVPMVHLCFVWTIISPSENEPPLFRSKAEEGVVL